MFHYGSWRAQSLSLIVILVIVENALFKENLKCLWVSADVFLLSFVIFGALKIVKKIYQRLLFLNDICKITFSLIYNQFSSFLLAKCTCPTISLNTSSPFYNTTMILLRVTSLQKSHFTCCRNLYLSWLRSRINISCSTNYSCKHIKLMTSSNNCLTLKSWNWRFILENKQLAFANICREWVLL